MDRVKQYVFSTVVYCFIRSSAYIFIEVTYAHELHVGRWLFIFCKGLDQLTAALLRLKRGERVPAQLGCEPAAFSILGAMP